MHCVRVSYLLPITSSVLTKYPVMLPTATSYGGHSASSFAALYTRIHALCCVCVCACVRCACAMVIMRCARDPSQAVLDNSFPPATSYGSHSASSFAALYTQYMEDVKVSVVPEANHYVVIRPNQQLLTPCPADPTNSYELREPFSVFVCCALTHEYALVYLPIMYGWFLCTYQ
jgi:hypothetical protein